MDNAEEILQSLEEFSKLKPKEIPKELDEYLGYVAKTGDPVYQWHLIKCLFREKLANVITEFYETSPSIDLPPCPNVDPFNYERMKTGLLERLDTFSSAPFTVQRICELLTGPRNQYNRVDKFMRAVEKNILVVSTREPGIGKRPESGGGGEDDQPPDSVLLNVNGLPEAAAAAAKEMTMIMMNNTTTTTAAPVATNGCDESSAPLATAACLPPVPVDNAVNVASVIQEEIEIAAAAASRDETSWMNSGHIKMVIDRAVTSEEQEEGDRSKGTTEKADEADAGEPGSMDCNTGNSSTPTTEQADVSKAETITAASEQVIKASSLQFVGNKGAKEMDSVEIEPGDDRNENVEVSATPDSPDSPEPREEILDREAEKGEVLPNKSSTVIKEVDEPRPVEEEEEEEIEENDSLQCSEVVSDKKIEEAEEIVSQPDTSSLSDSVNNVVVVAATSTIEERCQVVTADSEEAHLSPRCMVPDSSNDSFSANDNVVTEDTNENVTGQQYENSSSATEGENSAVCSKMSSQAPDNEIVTESIDELSHDRKSFEGREESVHLKSPTSSDSECVSIEVVEEDTTNVKEDDDDDEEGTAPAEISSKVLVEEPVVTEEEEEGREGGSVIQTMSSTSTTPSPPVSIEELGRRDQSQGGEVVAGVVVTAEEDISVDRSSCEVEDEEAEAMDVDENSSSQQMTLSEESEMTEDAEPMDQSDGQPPLS